MKLACPKDSFPLPRIDQLVDATAGHELLSFIVIVVHEGVIICNPKMDLKLEFEGPNTAEKRKWSAGGAGEAKGQARFNRHNLITINK